MEAVSIAERWLPKLICGMLWALVYLSGVAANTTHAEAVAMLSRWVSDLRGIHIPDMILVFALSIACVIVPLVMGIVFGPISAVGVDLAQQWLSSKFASIESLPTSVPKELAESLWTRSSSSFRYELSRNQIVEVMWRYLLNQKSSAIDSLRMYTSAGEIHREGGLPASLLMAVSPFMSVGHINPWVAGPFAVGLFLGGFGLVAMYDGIQQERWRRGVIFSYLAVTTISPISPIPASCAANSDGIEKSAGT